MTVKPFLLSLLSLVSIDKPDTEISQLGGWFVDYKAELSVNEAIERFENGSFSPSAGRIPNLGKVSGVVYSATKIQNNRQDREYVLEYSYAPLDYITTFIIKNGVVVRAHFTGDHAPLDLRFRKHRKSNILINVNPGESIVLLTKIDSSSMISLGIHLFTLDAYEDYIDDDTITLDFGRVNARGYRNDSACRCRHVYAD